MDMPDKIYLNDVDGDGVVDNFVWSTEKQIGNKTQYTRTDLTQSLADALEGLLEREWQDDEGDVTLESARLQARAALANYRKGESV